MRKHLAWLLLLACGPFAHAGDPGAALVEDMDLGFLLNNLRVIEEVDVGVPSLQITSLRLVTVPERDDKCSWVSKISNLSSFDRESLCPRRNLYLVFSSYDEQGGYDQNHRFRGQRAYHIGLALLWGFVGLEATEEKRSVVLRLKAEQIVHGKKRNRSVAIEISIRDGDYSVSTRVDPL